jgi:hypothetical protein
MPSYRFVFFSHPGRTAPSLHHQPSSCAATDPLISSRLDATEPLPRTRYLFLRFLRAEPSPHYAGGARSRSDRGLLRPTQDLLMDFFLRPTQDLLMDFFRGSLRGGAATVRNSSCRRRDWPLYGTDCTTPDAPQTALVSRRRHLQFPCLSYLIPEFRRNVLQVKLEQEPICFFS